MKYLMVTKQKPRLIRKWRYRIIRRNKNLLIIICGGTGSGKSYCALTIAKMIDPDFDVKTRVVFTVESFMELLNSGKLRKGSTIVWDEAGVGIPSREWYSISNKAISYVLQTFRHLNLCVIFTTPSFDYIDKQTRLLFHVYIETVKIIYEKNRVIVKVFENQFNPAMGKEYKKYFWIGGVKKERFNIGKPTKQMVKDYEEIKKIFSRKLRMEVQKDVQQFRQKERQKRVTNKELLAILYEIKATGDRPTLAAIQQEHGIGKDRASYLSMIVWGRRKRGRPKKDI